MDAGRPSNRFQDRKNPMVTFQSTFLVVEDHLFDAHVTDIFAGKEFRNAVPCLFHRFPDVHSDLLFRDPHLLHSCSPLA